MARISAQEYRRFLRELEAHRAAWEILIDRAPLDERYKKELKTALRKEPTKFTVVYTFEDFVWKTINHFYIAKEEAARKGSRKEAKAFFKKMRKHIWDFYKHFQGKL